MLDWQSYWHDIDSARDQWADAPLEDNLLEELLEIAQEQVLAYAPALPADYIGYPTSYRWAQLMQARAIWGATVSDGENIGPDGFAIPAPTPLDKHVRQMLRPRKAVPFV